MSRRQKVTGVTRIASVLGAAGLVVAGVLLVWTGMAYRTMKRASQPSATTIYSAGDFHVPLAAYARESLVRALSELETPSPYGIDGSGFQVRGGPSDEQVARDVSRSRLYLRLCRDLQAVGPAEATRLANEWLARLLAKYKEGLELKQPVRAGAGWISARDVQARLQPGILGLCLAAGNLELKGVHPLICDVVQEARKQRQEMPADEEIQGIPTSRVSLYNRQILGYALMATSEDPQPALKVLAAMGKEIVLEERPLKDAERIPYDAVPTPGPVDYSTGVFAVKYLPAITDEEFGLVVEAVLPAEDKVAGE